jgi:hypothetical protein
MKRPPLYSVRSAPYRVSISRYALRKFHEDQSMRVLRYLMRKVHIPTPDASGKDPK